MWRRILLRFGAMSSEQIDDGESLNAWDGPYDLPGGFWYFSEADKLHIKDYDAYYSWSR